MRLPKVRGDCVHCLRGCATTWDHGVPASWYPTASERNAARVKAPACIECNRRLKGIEEQLLLPLALCLDGSSAQAAGVVERAFRSISPGTARDVRDAGARRRRRKRVVETLFVPPRTDGVLPGFGPPSPLTLAVPLPAKLLDQFGDKLSRVVLWASHGEYVRSPYAVRTHVVDPVSNEVAMIEELIRGGERWDVPPSVFVAIRTAADDVCTAMVAMDLWGKLKLFTSIAKSEPSAGA